MATNNPTSLLSLFQGMAGPNQSLMETRVQVGYGVSNLPGESLSLRAYRVRPPFVKDTAVFTSVGPRSKLPSLAAGNSPLFGQFDYYELTHLSGTVLLLQALYTSNGSMFCACAVFVELSDSAPSIAVGFRVTPSPQGTISGNVVPSFSGRGYLLGTQELESMGYVFPSTSWPSMNMDEGDLEERCAILETAPGTTPVRPLMVEVPAPDDPDRTVLVRKALPPPRRINLSRGRK